MGSYITFPKPMDVLVYLPGFHPVEGGGELLPQLPPSSPPPPPNRKKERKKERGGWGKGRLQVYYFMCYYASQ